MRIRPIVLGNALLMSLIALLIPASVRAPQRAAISAPNLFSGVINGGCYAHAGFQCSIRIDAFQPISVDSGNALLAMQLRANGTTVYDFRSDVSNPPGGLYLPSNVALDFAARCGEPYVMTLHARQTSSTEFQLLGTTNEFVCPLLETPTPTPTPTSSQTPTSTQTPTPTSTPTRTPANTSTPRPGNIFLPNVSGSQP
jgi:hypothetical protein